MIEEINNFMYSIGQEYIILLMFIIGFSVLILLIRFDNLERFQSNFDEMTNHKNNK